MTAIKPLGDITNTASTSSPEIDSLSLRFAMQRAAYELIPNERIKVCLRYHRPDVNRINVMRSKTSKKAHYSGLMTCGSVWHCPICAARISEQRRQELTRSMLNWTGGNFMVTYTASHKVTTPLRDILEAVVEGVRSFKSGRRFQEIKSLYGWVGSVKALEVTYGANGWHPHVHELVFATNALSEAELDRIEVELSTHWLGVLGRRGWVASTEHGLKVSDDKFDLARYVSKFGHEPKMTIDDWKNKWSLAHEITKQVVKKSRTREGRTPMQLLADYLVDDFEAGEVWREYAKVFKGRKQLTWSNGMRKLLALGDEIPDEEIANEADDGYEVYASITLEQWRVILASESRAEILKNAAWMTQDEFANWMSDKIERLEHER